MKQISILFVCLFCSMLTMAQTTESITINGASSEGFITNISFSGNDAMVTYENGTQQTIDIAALSIDFDYTALLSDANETQNQVMLNTFGGKTVRVELTRTIVSGKWNTLCLPFYMTEAQIATVFGAGTQVAQFNGVENEVADFTKVNSIVAGIPYLINPTTTVSTIALDDINLKNLTAGGSMSTTDYSFIGTMATVVPTGDIYYFDQDNKVKKLANGESVKAFRAYLTSNGSDIKAFTIDGEMIGNLLGDVNGDTLVNITDVVLLVDYILERENPAFIIENADINSDDSINISDVTELVNIIMSRQ